MSSRPPWPLALTAGTPETGLGRLRKSALSTTSDPPFCVTTMRRSGKKAKLHGLVSAAAVLSRVTRRGPDGRGGGDAGGGGGGGGGELPSQEPGGAGGAGGRSGGGALSPPPPQLAMGTLIASQR